MKKFISAVSVIALLVAVTSLAGCGSATTGSGYHSRGYSSMASESGGGGGHGGQGGSGGDGGGGGSVDPHVPDNTPVTNEPPKSRDEPELADGPDDPYPSPVSN